mgnify:CR=1 FL=1
MERLGGPNSVKVISVIEVKAKRGFGIKGDPVREITQYWDKDGNFLAERDDEPQMLCEQAQWESERLRVIIENYAKNRKLQ